MAIEDNAQEKLMEQLRQGYKQVRSFDEIAQLLHVISSEQKARNMLRSCTDKVLMNMSDIHSLRDILDRLRSVARTNGLLFKLLLEKQSIVPETSCQISGDLFELEIVLDGRDNHFNGPAVLDVNITYSKQTKSCPELVEIIRNGKFLELSKHLKALIELYPMSLDRQTKLKVYMALQSLETDVNKMSQLYRDSHSNNESVNIAMHGLVGLLAPRVTGMGYHLHYFLTPYDLLNLKTGNFVKALDQLDEKSGLQAEIRIKSHTSSSILPITPLISNNHPVSGTEKPRFLDVNQHNSLTLPACFVLKLKPKVLLVQQIASEIEKETSMSLFEKDEVQSYLSLLKKDNTVQEVLFESQHHIYNLNVNHLKGAFVSEIHFTHPGHLVSILNSLRKQSYLNSIFESCIRPKKNGGEEIQVWHYDVSLENNMSNLLITFQHPLSPNSTASAEIALSGDGFLSCRLFTGRSDPILCSDQYALNILQKSFSLPLLMRAIILQTQRNPRKEPDRHRTSRQSIYQHRATSQVNKKPPAPPPISQSQPKPPNATASASPAPTTTAQALHKPMFPAFKPSATPEPLDQNKKETQHPMLTQLLKPHGQAVKTQAVQAQTKTHPMLLDLLKENEANAKMAPQQQQSHVMHQRPPLQTDLPQHQTPPPPQYGANNQLSMPYGQQLSQPQSQEQMPPPPSYYPSGPVKSSMQHQQQQYQAPQQIPPNYSNPSPLGFEELAGGPSLTQLPSPYNAQGNASHSTTPPLFSLIPSPLASPSSQPSPMSFAPSPRQPPMNTPQPLSMTSPRHSAMTPPMHSPAARRVSVGRRVSRQKSRSTDQSIDNRNDVTEIGFTAPFDMISESDPNQLPDMQDVFGAVGSPAISSARSQRHLSGDRPFNFSFDADLLDTDNQRRNSFGRRLSNQPFMTPSPALSTQESQDTNFPIPSPVGSIEGFQAASFALSDNKPALSDVQQQHQIFGSKPMDLPSGVEGAAEERNPPSIGLPQDQSDVDPFNFDDNKTPQKISMPDSMSDPKSRPGLSSRSSSISSNSGAEESTLKVLLATGPGGGSTNFNKTGKAEKTASNQTGKGGAVGQRRGSQDFVTSGARSVDGGSSAAALSHKPLVRQNAIGKGSPLLSKFQSLQDNKEKAKKKSGKDDKGPPKRRGRPPSTDKKEHAVKRKKAEGSGEDSELRGKIVLNVQLNKGTPISSTTKTRPVPAEPPAEKTPSSASSSATSSGSSASTTSESKKLDNIQQYPTDLQQYLLDQGKLEKKKKEKKIASGSPLASINKNNNKSTLQTAGSGNSAAIRSQLASSKSVTSAAPGTSKSATLPHQKSGPATSQPKPAGIRSVGRKASIKDVGELLRAKAESAVVKSGQGQVAGNGEKRTAAGSVTPKPSDRLGTSEHGIKLKGVQPSSAPKFMQYSKLVVSKSPGDERAVAVKPSGPLKHGMRSKSPGSHPVKQTVGTSRVPVQAKRDKTRPVTPVRDTKAGTVSAAAILKNQPSVVLSNTKTDKVPAKLLTDPATQAKATGGQNTDQAKRAIPNRPPSANKSPRSVTPPQARPPSQSGTVQSKPSSRSPGHSTESNRIASESGDDVSRFRSNLGKRPSLQDPPFLPPSAKKLAVPGEQSSDARGGPRASPRSPDDRLVIDDGTDDVTNASNQAVRTATPPISQPPPLTHSAALNPYANVPATATDFSASPAIPCDIDDDQLMNDVVSGELH